MAVVENKVEETDNATAGVHTPPHSDNGDTKIEKTESPAKGKDTEPKPQNENSFKGNLIDKPTHVLNDSKAQTEDPEPAATDDMPPPSKKRGRPKASDKETSKDSKKIKPEPKEKKPKPTAAKSETEKPSTLKPKKGRPATSNGGFTKEQDDYLRELFTNKVPLQELHAKFEERFKTNRSSNILRFRWYKLRDEAVVLTDAEETALRKAIKEIETNKALAVLSHYGKGGESFQKLTQAFVWNKIKEWGSEGGGAKPGANIKEDVDVGEED